MMLATPHHQPPVEADAVVVVVELVEVCEGVCWHLSWVESEGKPMQQQSLPVRLLHLG
jgi:hypothetical protein